jgi:hypothetical protein
MGEPKAVTYKQVEKATGGTGSRELWDKIGAISGAGQVGLDPSGNASIDLTDASDSVRDRIDKLLNPEQEVVIDESKSKRGNK